MRALAILGVEACAIAVLIASVSAILNTADVVVLTVVREVTVRPRFDPSTTALTRCNIVAGQSVAICADMPATSTVVVVVSWRWRCTTLLAEASVASLG